MVAGTVVVLLLSGSSDTIPTAPAGDARQRVRLTRYRPRTVRLIVARCEVRYSGRIDALLPEAVRLLVVKADGSVLVHADAGGYKPLNCDLT
jgi:RecB family endonuclease NucS